MTARTTLFEDFSGGIDRRNGLVGHDGTAFFDLVNYYVTPGKKLRRRFPLSQDAGTLDATLTQGSEYINGKTLVVAKAGTSPTVTATNVRVLYFDNPEYCTTWTLLWLGTVNETPCAVIRHTFPGGTVTSRIMLHVWDDVRPTWTDDPAAPTNWSTGFPMHAYGDGVAGAFSDYTPAVALTASRWCISTPSGDIALSSVNRPRVWNKRTADEFLTEGRWWYWIMPSGVSNNAAEFFIDVPYDDFIADQRYAAFVVEHCRPVEGTWELLSQRVSAVDNTNFTFSLRSTANPYTGVGTGTTVRVVIGDAAGEVIRLRALAKPPMSVQTGGSAIPPNKLIGGILGIEGKSAIVDTSTLSFPGDGTYVISLVWPTAPGGPPTVSAYSASAVVATGPQRYWSRMRAIVQAVSGSFSLSHTGSVTTQPGSRVVVGVGTLFLTETAPGRYIEIQGESIKVTAVRDDLTLEVEAPFSLYGTGLIALKDLRYRYAYEVGDTGNEWYATREAEATFTLSGAADTAVIKTSINDPGGGPIINLAPANNRLLVQYGDIVQLWQIGEALASFQLLAIGAQNGVAGKGILVDGFTVLPSVDGPRFFSPDGNNKDYLQYDPVSDKLAGFTLPVFTHAVWWQAMRLAVFVSTAGEIYVLSFHPKAKIGAWSRWITTPVLSNVEGVYVDADDLVIRNNGTRYRFARTATSFIDVGDSPTAPYASTAQWLASDFGMPLRNKRFVRCEVAQTGKATLSLALDPAWTTASEVTGPSPVGYTHGRASVPLVGAAVSVALGVESTDPAGHTLDGVAFQYIPLKR